MAELAQHHRNERSREGAMTTTKTTKLLGLAFILSLFGAVACGEDPSSGEAESSSGGSGGSGGSASSGGSGVGSESAGGSVAGGASSGGSGTGGDQTGGVGGSGGGSPVGVPHVFVGTTDGFVRVYTMEESDGSLVDAGGLDTGDWLDFMTVGPDNRTVFVSYGGNVSAFAYDPQAKMLTLLDNATTFGAGTHVEVDPTGSFVFVAHYNEGKMTFLPFSQAGGFGSGQELSPGRNAHQTRVDATGTHVYVPCLDDDYVAQYVLNPSAGSLTPAATAHVAAGDGPRHLDFHPKARVAYVLDEVQSAVQVFDVASDGTLMRRASDEVYMSLDQAFHQSSDLHVTPDGKFVYALNRQPSEVVTFQVEANYSLTRLHADPLPTVVRSFAMDPNGRYLHLGGDNGTLVALQIDGATGELTETYSDTGLGAINATLTRYIEP